MMKNLYILVLIQGKSLLFLNFFLFQEKKGKYKKDQKNKRCEI